MNEHNGNTAATRRQILTGGVALVKTVAQAQPEIPAPDIATKQVRVYVTDAELEAWTIDVIAAFADGIPLVKVFQDARAKTQNEHLQRFSQDAPDILKKGYVLSDLMEMNRHIFTRDYVTTVRYGEIYGEVDVSLAKWLQDRPNRE